MVMSEVSKQGKLRHRGQVQVQLCSTSQGPVGLEAKSPFQRQLDAWGQVPVAGKGWWGLA